MKFLIIFFISIFLYSRTITPSDVYAEVKNIAQIVDYLLNYYNIKYKVNNYNKRINIAVKPRNVWQKSYEVMTKINILRNKFQLPTVSPVNMAPVLNLNPDLVYEQTQRIITELKIFMYRQGIPYPKIKRLKYIGKTPTDVFNGLEKISKALDELNQSSFTPSYVFAENMRVYDDISLILKHLNIEDKTIPAKKNSKATPNDTFEVGINTLEKIKQLQISVGIPFVDFTPLKGGKKTPSDVFGITQMIIAELQTIKAYIGLDRVTPSAEKYYNKTPIEVHQLMSWNLRKLNLIKNLFNRGQY